MCARGRKRTLFSHRGPDGAAFTLAPEEASFHGYVRDLSVGGLTLSTEVDLCAGLYLDIKLPGGADAGEGRPGAAKASGRRRAEGRANEGGRRAALPAALKGRIVRALGNGRYGLELVEMSEREKASIMAFIIEQEALMKKYGLVF